MSVNEKMTGIADAIRRYTGRSDKLSLDGMATGVSEVFGVGNTDGYNNGYNEGREEGLSEGRTQGYSLGFEEGKAAERDAFWEVFQKGGTQSNYYYAFANTRFTDNNYNPKYDIVIGNATTTGRYVFYAAAGITDTKVAIYAPTTNIDYCFMNSGLQTIRKLVLQDTTSYNSTFSGCDELIELNVEGVIGKNGFDVHWSTKLNKASIESIINVLSATTSGLTVTFSKTAVNNAFGIDVDDTTTYPEGSEYYNLRYSKSNWTFAYN